MSKVIQHGLSSSQTKPLSEEGHVEDLVKSLLLHRWKPPDEWELVNVVNEPYASQPSSSVSLYQPSTAQQTADPSPAPSPSYTTTELSSDVDSQPRIRRKNMEAFSSWLLKFHHSPHQPLYSSDPFNPYVHLPSEFQKFTSRHYLKLSTLKSINRCPTNWNALYQPADLNPFFNLCQQLDSSVLSAHQHREDTVSAPFLQQVDRSTPLSTFDYLTRLWCDPIELRLSQHSEEEEKYEENHELKVPSADGRNVNVSETKKCRSGVPIKRFDATCDSLRRRSHQTIQVKFPFPLQIEPYGLLFSLLSPLSLGPGSVFFWSRAYFEYNLLSSLPRLSLSHRSQKKPFRKITTPCALPASALNEVSPKGSTVPVAVVTKVDTSSLAKIPTTVPHLRESRGPPKKPVPRALSAQGKRRKQAHPVNNPAGVCHPRTRKTVRKTVLITRQFFPTDSHPNVLNARKRRCSKTRLTEKTIDISSPPKKMKRKSMVSDSAWEKIPTERQAVLAAKKEQQHS